jgi:uncharacterized protein
VIEERDQMVAMRDGTRLCVDVFRPEAPGRYPALIGLSPYGKDIQSLPIPPQPPTSPVYSRQIEAGDPSYLTDHGYVHVIADTRGIGKSEDSYRGWMSPDEARDGHDLVEWAAEQPWCTGRVGMVGVSYYGAVQLMVAATRPPHLKAIMPWNAPTDFYREGTHHGGILHVFFTLIYKLQVRGRSSSTVMERSSEEQVRELARTLAADPDLGMYPDLYNMAVNPDRVPGFFDVLAHPLDGPFYWERSAYTKYDAIDVPAYCASGWWAYGHMHLRGAFQNFAGIKGPTKLYIESRVEAPAPMGRDYNEEVVRWYDHWLKGRDNGIMDEPPVRIHVRSEGFRFEDEWPLARTEWARLHLSRFGALSREPEVEAGMPDVFTQQPVQETAAIASVEYSTPRFDADLEVIGPVALYLHAAIDGEDTNWMVSLLDVNPLGHPTEVTRGFLKASHRALDAERSQPWLPVHPHDVAEPVRPGEIYEYAIELSPVANIFRRNHRLVVSISCQDHAHWPPADLEIGGAGHMPWHVCSSRTTTHRIFHDPQHPSHLLLPVIPRG